MTKKKQTPEEAISSQPLAGSGRIHGQCFHQQTIAESFVAENFMGIVGYHWYKAIDLS